MKQAFLAEITQTMGQMYDIMLDNYRQGVESKQALVSGLTGGEGWRLKNQIKGGPRWYLCKSSSSRYGNFQYQCFHGTDRRCTNCRILRHHSGSVITLAMEYGKTRERW